MTIEELKTNLAIKEWRLNNLYWITDKKGKRVKFKMNWAQKKFFDNMHCLNIILKARQLGFSTLIEIILLDSSLFEMKDSGVIAHTQNDSERIFDSKIKFAWDNLPEELRKQFKVDSDSARSLKFSRGNKTANISVGTSLRSSTNQNLHISELSSVDQKYPDKAEEIRTGALNTVAIGQKVFIESTAKGRTGVFYDLCKIAMDNEKLGKPLTDLDYKFHFFSWLDNPEYVLKGENVLIPSEMKEYFDQLEIELKRTITPEQRFWYYKMSLIQKDKMKSEYPSTAEEAFLATIEGAYYSKELSRVREEKRITKVPYDTHLKVNTYWDIGVGDSTAIVFTQNTGLEVRIIDYYENSGEGLRHYINILDKKGYTYGYHYAPHDIQVKDFSVGGGKTRLDVAMSLGLNFLITPKLSLEDGIEATRNILGRCWFDEERTDQLVVNLTGYHKQWNDKYGDWMDYPAKSPCNHGCLVGNTLIETSKGKKEIKDVVIGDMVRTPVGYSKVLNSGAVKQTKDIIKITLEDGNIIRATPEHKFFTNRGVVIADTLRYNDSIINTNYKLCEKNSLYSKAINTGFRETIIGQTTSQTQTYTELYGKIITKQKFQRIVIYITKTAIHLITGLKTLNVSLRNLIYHITLKEANGLVVKETENNSLQHKNLLKNGTEAKKGLNGTVKMERNVGKIKSILRRFVKNVEESMKHHFQQEVNIATKIVKLEREQKDLETVYDLTVDKHHCYFANSLLVSNSDAFRYMAVNMRDEVLYKPDEEELEMYKQQHEDFNIFNF